MRLLEKILPYIILGITIALLILALVVLSYVIFWGILLGLLIYGIAWVKNKFFTPKSQSLNEETSGRIIEHNDVTLDNEKENDQS